MNVEKIYARYSAKVEDGHIYDPIRMRYVKATPEEIVRQKTLKFLTKRLHVPMNTIIVERSLASLGVTGSKKRIDIGILDDDNLIMAVVECKATKVGVGEAAFEQAKDYLLELFTRYYFVTDGVTFDGFFYDTEDFLPLDEIPKYDKWYSYPSRKDGS